MNEPFLLQVARHYAETLESSQPGDYTFVFPNRRSSLFFKKYLGEAVDGTFFVPTVLTISDFFRSLGSLEVPDSLTLVFELWKVYKKYNGPGDAGDSLDDFLGWGSLLLSDFSDVDHYLADARQLFANIKDQKDIEADTSYLSEEQIEAVKRLVGMRADADSKEFKRKFFSVWDSMYSVYSDFRDALLQKGMAYGAMQYRLVAEAVADKSVEPQEPFKSIREKLGRFRKVVFVGFSAPTNCEKSLMRFFKNRKCADGTSSGEFFWDFHSRKIRDDGNRASTRIALCEKEFPSKIKLDYEENTDCVFNVIRASGNSQQTQILSSVLKEISSAEGWRAEKDAIKTAVVVSNENLLFPLLSSIPRSFASAGEDSVNITMPYPLKATPVASLESLLAALNINARIRDGRTVLLGKDFRNIIDHPYVRRIDAAGCSRIIKRIAADNLYFIDAEAIAGDILKDERGEIPGISEPLRRFVTEIIVPRGAMVGALAPGFSGSGLIRDIAAYQSELLSFIEEGLPREDKGYIYKYVDALNTLKNSNIPICKLRTAYSVIRSLTSSQSISFVGEPLRGLQIMGPLETRLLDFDNVVFLSFNEGYFPASGVQKSAIPYFLRKVFGLPTYEDKDSVSSYNFYRLIQRARKCYFIYDTDNQDDRTSVKEASRFIKQLEYLYDAPVVYREFGIANPELKETPGIIPSDSLSKSFFDAGAARRLSASSLKNYLACPAKFYFSRILNISEEDELTETVDSRGFGSIFHDCMKRIYDCYREEGRRVLTADALSGILRDLKSGDPGKSARHYADTAFAEVARIRRIDGENLIIRELVKDYIIRLFEVDKARLTLDTSCAEQDGGNFCFGPFRVTGTEDKCDVTLFGKMFTGSFDRVDMTGRGVLISDYKTGKVDIPAFLTGKNRDFYRYCERNDVTAGHLAGRSAVRPSPVFPEFTLNGDNISELLDGYIIPFEESGGADGCGSKTAPPVIRLEESRDSFYDIVFQILLYASMYRRRCGERQSGNCGAGEGYDTIGVSVYPLRHIGTKGMITAHLTSGAIDRFDASLARLLDALEADCRERGFRLNGQSGSPARGSVCAYCDFKKFCNR